MTNKKISQLTTGVLDINTDYFVSAKGGVNYKYLIGQLHAPVIAGTIPFTAIDINGGAINGTPIGALPGTASTGKFTSLELPSGGTIVEFSIDGTLTDNADNALPTEKAVKTYVDARVGANITAVGTVGTGTWNADTITVSKGGTGTTSLTQYGIVLGNGSNAVNVLGVGTLNQILRSNGAGFNPSWIDMDISFDTTPALGGSLDCGLYDINVKTNKKVTFRDAVTSISSKNADYLDLDALVAVRFNTPEVVIGGALTAKGGTSELDVIRTTDLTVIGDFTLTGSIIGGAADTFAFWGNVPTTKPLTIAAAINSSYDIVDSTGATPDSNHEITALWIEYNAGELDIKFATIAAEYNLLRGDVVNIRTQFNDLLAKMKTIGLITA